MPGCGSIVTSLGLPSVSVPVLSTTSVVTFSRTSSASALRISTPAFGAAAGADHDRHRRRQAERARARDDQDGDGIDERVRQSRLRPIDCPDDERHDGHGDDDRHEPAGHRVGQPLNRRAGSLRLAHHAHDLCEQRVAADALRLA